MLGKRRAGQQLEPAPAVHRAQRLLQEVQTLGHGVVVRRGEAESIKLIFISHQHRALRLLRHKIDYL